MSEALGERIRRLRHTARLTQQALADHAGISYNYLWRLEKGERAEVGGAVLLALADALGVSADYLLTGAAEPAPAPAAPLPGAVARLIAGILALPEPGRTHLLHVYEVLLQAAMELNALTPRPDEAEFLHLIRGLTPAEQTALRELLRSERDADAGAVGSCGTRAIKRAKRTIGSGALRYSGPLGTEWV